MEIEPDRLGQAGTAQSDLAGAEAHCADRQTRHKNHFHGILRNDTVLHHAPDPEGARPGRGYGPLGLTAAVGSEGRLVDMYIQPRSVKRDHLARNRVALIVVQGDDDGGSRLAVGSHR